MIGQPRSTQRYTAIVKDDEEALRSDIIRFATQYGRFGYRRVDALLREAGWRINHKRLERIWRQEGLKVPKKQPKRGRLWLNDGSCIRLRPTHRNHVWSYDFVMDRTHNGRPIKILTVIDEYSRECLAIVVDRKIKSDDVLYCLSDLFLLHGIPERIGVRTLFIEPGSPWENGYNESFNGKLRDEVLNREVFYNLKEAKVIIERWRQEYNTVRPHSSLDYRPPSPETIMPLHFDPFWLSSSQENIGQILT